MNKKITLMTVIMTFMSMAAVAQVIPANSTKSPEEGKWYKLYDVTQSRWVDTWEAGAYAVTDAGSARMFYFSVERDGDAIYMVTDATVNNRGAWFMGTYLKNSYNSATNIWIDGAKNDYAKWYTEDGTNGVYLYPATANLSDGDVASSDTKNYLRHNSAIGSGNGLSLDATATDEFLFVEVGATATKDDIKSLGTTTLETGDGHDYYIYDYTQGMFLNLDGKTTKPTSSAPSLLFNVPTPEVGQAFYNIKSSYNNWKNYLIAGNYLSKYVYCDGNNSAANSQWYFTEVGKPGTGNTLRIEVGETQGGAAGAQTRSESVHLYVYYDGSVLNFTTDAAQADEFVFITRDAYKQAKTLTAINDATEGLQASAVEGKVLIDRTISATNYSTLYLPFALTAEEMNTVFGTKANGREAYWLNTVDRDGDNFTLNFSEATTVEPGFPILVKRGTDAAWNGSSFEFVGKTVTPARNAASANDTKNGITFTGAYARTTLAANDFFISNNTIYRAASSGSYVLPTRAYFATDIVSSAKNIKLIFGNDEITTSIDALNNGVIEPEGQVFNLSGQRVEGQLRNGIYIKNGKKFIVK